MNFYLFMCFLDMQCFEEIFLQLKLSVLFIVNFQFLKGICYIEYD